MLCKYPGETCANMIFHHSKVYCNNGFCHLHDDPPLCTNADWIRGMSDEELAMFLKEEMFNDFKPSCPESTFFSAENRPECDTGCVPCILNWLRQPVDNGVSSQNVRLISGVKDFASVVTHERNLGHKIACVECGAVFEDDDFAFAHGTGLCQYCHKSIEALLVKN